MPAPMGNRYATRSQRSSNVAKKAARNAMMKVSGGTANTNVKTAVNTDTNDPTAGVTQNQLDRVVQSVNDATNRLSQPESAFSISTTTKSSKRRSRDTVGPWKLGKTLGKGSSGRVRLAKNMETGQLAAIKIVPKKKCKNDPGSHSSSKSTESDFSATMNTTTNTNRATTNGGTNANAGPSEVPANPYGIEREIVIMKLISHSNILGLYEVWENKSELYLVLEYVDGGELFDYLVSRGKLGEREAVHYFKQIVQGVSYCHSFNICHRDLKPENLLLDKKNKSIKIADFGMAALEVSNKLLQTSCGSPHYASPEIVMGRPYHGGPSDVWSCGIILFALLTGHLPFNDDNIKKLLLKVQSGKFHMPQNLSAEAKDLMSKILVVNPFKRIATEEILNHPLLTKYDKLVKPVKYRSSVNPVTLSQGKSNSDLHVLDASNSNIVDLRSREDIDDSIVSNLQILWHGASRELIVAKLLQPRMSEEKLFYSLLLSYKEKHSPKPESEAPPQFEPTQPTDEIQQPQIAPLQPPSLEPTLAPEVVQQSLPAQDEEDEEELTKSQTTNEEDSSQLNESQDTSAPKLPQKSQFSASSIDQHSMSGFSSMQSAALSGVPSVPANSLPPAMPIFTAPSSRTFKNSGPALSIPSKKSLKHSASKTSLNHSASKKSLHHSASRKSLVHASPSTTSLHNSASKKSLHNSPPKKTLQNSASKRSLYSQTSISKRSLNLSEYVGTENAVISEMEQQLKPNLPSSESNGDFEKLCEQILFGNALEKILEEEEDDGASATTSNTSQRTLTKVDASQRSPHSSDSKNKTPAAKTIPPAFELNTPESEEEQQLRASAHKNLLAEENNRYPFKDITNNPTLAPSDSKPSKSKRDVSQKSDLSEVLNSNQFGGSTFSSNDVLRNNSRKSEFKPSLRVTNDVRSASENQSKPVQPSYSLDPRRNATQPVNPKVVASLLKRAKTKKNIRDARKSGDWGYISGSHFNTNTDINFDDKLENIFDHGFNNRLDGNLERGLVDSGLKRASEDTRSSLWQPSLRDSHVESDAEHNTSGTNEFFDTSDVNVLAHSSIIQKPNDVTRQPSLLSHTGTFKNLSEYLHKEGNANNIANRSHEENPSNVMRKKSTELNLAPRSTLTAALDPKDRSMYTNSFMSNMSDMSYVMEMPSRTYEAQAIEVSNNSSADDITDLPVNSDREFGQSSSQGQHTTATFEDNNVNIFEDAPVDSDSSDTASEDSQQNVRRKAVSIDTLHTTNVLTPATNVRVSLYLNNNNHTESPLKRETTEEIISKFKLSPEKSSQPLVQKRYSALAANRNSDIHSTMTMFKDLEEEQDAEDISQWKPSESPAGEGQEKPNRVTMLFDNEEEMPQLEHQITPTPEVPQKNENRSVPDTKSTRASEEKSMKSIDEGLQKAEELPHTNESSKQLKEPPMHAPPQPKSKVKSSGSPLPAKSKKSKPMKEKSQTATAASTATPSAPPNVSNSAAATPSSASPAPRKQNWFTKLFGGFKSQKSDLGRLQQDHFTKISFDDAHLLTLHEFDKNAVEYHLKSLDHKLHDEKVEYDCKFPTGFAFKIKITTTVLGQKNSTILTVKKKGRNTSSDVKGAFQMFNQNVANVIREAEMGYNV